jgi:membrane protease YdiL (CAAX protease family)
MSIVFASFFGVTMVLAIRRQDQGEPLVNIDAVLPNSILFIAFTAGIIGFLRYRGLRLAHVFGFDQLTPLASIGWACGLLFAALPVAGAANALTVMALKDHISPQPLVELFSHVSREHDYMSVTKILVSGVIIQPACEEFLFRGFFYGVWKRYLGAVPSGFLSCLLFAAFHTSLTALAGLFVLAVCLNLAYERTGSLLVPIGMHALFNFVSLLFLYTQAQFPLPA